MRIVGAILAGTAGLPRPFGLLAACILLAAILIACGGNNGATGERILDLEAKAHSQEEALERLTDENAALREELAALKQAQADSARALEEAATARELAAEDEREEIILEDFQAEQLSSLLEEQVRNERRLGDHESRLGDLEEVAAQLEFFPAHPWRSGSPAWTNGWRCLREPGWKGPSVWRKLPEARFFASTSLNPKNEQYWSCPWNR